MAITDWPMNSRPRERLLKHGAKTLNDAELLAIFLRTGCCGLSALDLGEQLIKHFGGLRSLLAADQQAFCAAKGLGPAKYAQLAAVLELAKRHQEEQLKQHSVLENPAATQAYLKLKLDHYPYEVFACLFLDNRHRVISFEELFRGTIDGASVHPREVMRQVITHNAAAVIFAHNHPSGVAEPSIADEQVTQRLKKALAYIDVRVLDHIVVAANHSVSLAERGLL